jgi:pimeloyl-ACP methyl ester carboxylesterase
MAPHVFIEPECLGESIRSRHEAFKDRFQGKAGPLPPRRARRPSTAGRTCGSIRSSAAGTSRDEYLPKIQCPVLAIQGHDDEYGTMAQLDEIQKRAGRCKC